MKRSPIRQYRETGTSSGNCIHGESIRRRLFGVSRVACNANFYVSPEVKPAASDR
jgi:hypothetical protein